MEKLMEINAVVFNYLQVKMKMLGIDADRRSFAEIHRILNENVIFTPEEFAHECFYVVCVAGFKQDYAKAMCEKVINFIDKNDKTLYLYQLLKNGQFRIIFSIKLSPKK